MNYSPVFIVILRILFSGKNEKPCAPGRELPLSVLNTKNTNIGNQIRQGLLDNSHACDVIMVV